MPDPDDYLSTDETAPAGEDSRFGIDVPKPGAFMNLGKPKQVADEPGKNFGYPGYSLKSKDHHFTTVSGVTVFQGSDDALWQVKGNWLQCAKGNMALTCLGNTTVAALRNVTVVAPSGMGPSARLDYGNKLRSEAYNNLYIHYAVDDLHSGLKSLFYGDSWRSESRKGQATAVARSRDINLATATALDVKEGADPAYGGLLGELWDKLGELGWTEAQRISVLEPFEWESDHWEMHGLCPVGFPGSAYPAVSRFDPYPNIPLNRSSLKGVPLNIYAAIYQLFNWARRFADVFRYILPAIEKFPVCKFVMGYLSAFEKLALIVPSLADLFVEDFASLPDDQVAEWNKWLDGMKKTFWVPKEDTKATITSQTEPFDPNGIAVTNLYLEVADAKEDTLVQTVRFGCIPARVTLTAHAGFRAVDITLVDPNQPASITVGGTTAVYAASSDVSTTPEWQDLPATSDFHWAPKGKRLKRWDGALFTVGQATNVTYSETTSDSVTVTIDGSPTNVSLQDVVNETGSTARATKLAELIDSTGRKASASGSSVTVSGGIGKKGQVKVAGPLDALARVGLTGEIEIRGADFSATTVAAAITAVRGNYTATVEPSTGTDPKKVKVEHTTAGSDSYLKITGPFTERIFGKEIAESTGKSGSAMAGKTFQEGYRGIVSTASMVLQIPKWPSRFSNLLRPLINRFIDVADRFDELEGAVRTAMKGMGADPLPKYNVGLFSGQGGMMTLGANGPLFGLGQAITFVAMPQGHRDGWKKIPGLEHLLMDYMLAASWKKKFKLTKALFANEAFKVKPAKPAHKGPAGFRVVSSQDICLLSKNHTRIASLKDITLDGASVQINASGKTEICSKESWMKVYGKYIVVGSREDDGPQKATERLALYSKDGITAATNKLMFSLWGDSCSLGKLDDQSLIGKVGKTTPYLELDASGSGKVGLGIGDGANALEIEGTDKLNLSSGTAKITGKTEVTLAGGSAGLKVAGSDVEVTGGFKVGTELIVKSIGVMAPTPMLKGLEIPENVELKRQTLKAKHLALTTQAKVMLKALVLLRTAQSEAREAFREDQSEASGKLVQQLRKARSEMAELYLGVQGQIDEVLAEAELVGLVLEEE